MGLFYGVLNNDAPQKLNKKSQVIVFYSVADNIQTRKMF